MLVRRPPPTLMASVWRGVHGQQVGAHDIVDVGEVAGLLAIAKDGDRLVRRGGVQEPLEGHVRPLAAAVHGEVAQRQHRHLGHPRPGVGQGEVLAGQLGDAVG
jgi:hypothetical protein